MAGFRHIDQPGTGSLTMTRAEFIAQLRRALAGMAPTEIDDIAADYSAHFDEGAGAGRSEQDVASALGDPQRLARELRAEAGLRRWETQRTPAALVAAVVSLGGLLALDIIILLPLLFAFGVVALVIGVLLFAGGIVGLVLLLSGLLHWHGLAAIGFLAAHALAGIGLLGGSLGCGALLWLLLEGVVKLLGRYARLHYQVLKPAIAGA
jgi:uncharacterized membrane protein